MNTVCGDFLDTYNKQGVNIMKTLCYYIERTEDYTKFLIALEGAMTLVPCFVSMGDVEMNFVELTVLCREEDALFIQTVLAPYL